VLGRRVLRGSGFEGGMCVGDADEFGEGNGFGDGDGLGKQMGLWAGDGFGEGDGVGAEVTRQIADFCGYTKISKNCAKVPKTHHWQTEK